MGLLGFLPGVGGGPRRRVGERRVTAELRDQIMEMRADEVPADEIADTLGLSPRTVYRVLAAARDASDLDPLVELRQRLERKKMEVQIEALDDPDVQDQVRSQVFGPGRDKPVDQVTIEKVIAFLEAQGRTVVDKEWLGELKQRAKDLEESLKAAEDEIDDLNDQLRAGGGENGMLVSLARELIPNLKKGQPAMPGATVQEVPSTSPSSASSAAAPQLAAPDAGGFLKNLTNLPAKEAAELLYNAAAGGMEIGGVAVVDAVQLLLVASTPDQVAVLLADIPGVEAIRQVIAERPDWAQALLAALRTIHFERSGQAPAAAEPTAQPAATAPTDEPVAV